MYFAIREEERRSTCPIPYHGTFQLTTVKSFACDCMRMCNDPTTAVKEDKQHS